MLGPLSLTEVKASAHKAAGAGAHNPTVQSFRTVVPIQAAAIRFFVQTWVLCGKRFFTDQPVSWPTSQEAVVSTGLSSPAPPKATAACLDTCRLQLVRKNAFQITAFVSASPALLACLPPPLTCTPHPPSVSPHGEGCGSWVGGCWSGVWPGPLFIYPRTLLLCGRDRLLSISQAVGGSILNSEIALS